MNTFTSFEETIRLAEQAFQENRIEDALIHYSEALHHTKNPEQKLDLNNILGQLFVSRKNMKKAIAHFEDSIQIYESFDEEKQLAYKGIFGAILNTLGLIHVEANPKTAAELHEKAVKSFTDLNETAKDGSYKAHLANSYFSWGDALNRQKEPFFAKKHFKNALVLYRELSEKTPETYRELMANVHYQLGTIYNDDSAVYDAKMHFKNALKIYEELHQLDPDKYRVFLAATLNNLGAVAKLMAHLDESKRYYEKALEQHTLLAELNANHFSPYLAATHNSLAIVLAEMEERKTAAKHYEKAAKLYNGLAEESPETYTHYLATILHNLGIIYDEMLDFEQSMKYYEQALSIRLDLADKHPDDFDPDYCITAMNIVTLYQTMAEKEANIRYKQPADKLLQEIKKRILRFSDEHPTIESLKSDLDYYLVYFAQLTQEYLEVLKLMSELDEQTKELDSSINPTEKIALQKEMLEQVAALMEKYPANERLLHEWYAGEVKLAWLLIRSKAFDEALQIIQKWKAEKKDPALEINLAHLYLLSGKVNEAQERYQKYKRVKGPDNQPWKIAIGKDLDTLIRDGNDKMLLTEIKKTLN